LHLLLFNNVFHAALAFSTVDVLEKATCARNVLVQVSVDSRLPSEHWTNLAMEADCPVVLLI
jgi:hypothetical protein